MNDQLIESPHAVPPPSYDCQACGACCSYFAHALHGMAMDAEAGAVPESMRWDAGPMTWAEFAARINVAPEKFGELYRPDEPYLYRWFLKTKETSGSGKCCIALEGQVGVQASCGIYAGRPKTCAEFEPGSLKCLKARCWWRDGRDILPGPDTAEVPHPSVRLRLELLEAEEAAAGAKRLAAMEANIKEVLEVADEQERTARAGKCARADSDPRVAI